MKIKKVTASILVMSMVLGFSGCGKTSAQKKISALMDGFISGLTDYDYEEVLELTNWDEDDDKSKELKDILEFVEAGDSLYEYQKYITSNIKIDYDAKDIDVSGKTATLKFKYELVDWKPVYDEPHGNYDEVLSQLKKTKDKTSVKAKFTFELENGDWKISKISDLMDLFEYADKIPYIYFDEPDPIDVPPVDTTPTGIDPTGTVFADSYDKALLAYVDVLEANKDKIDLIGANFEMANVWIVDIDNNGLPELCFLASRDSTGFSADFYMYSYSEYAGEALLTLNIPEVIYLAGGGGEFVCYTTSEELVFTKSFGEEVLYQTQTNIYQLNWSMEVPQWNYLGDYRRDQSMYYDDATGDTTVTNEYFSAGGVKIDQASYESILKEYTQDAKLVVASRYYIPTDAVEYPSYSVPQTSAYSCDTAINILKTQM